MTLDIFVGNRNEYCVSGTTRGIFTVIVTELEKGKAGSRFLRIHDLSQPDIKIPYRKIDALIEELFQARSELASVPYPVAACFSGKMEVGYRSMTKPDGEFKSGYEDYPKNERHYRAGVDEKGLFVFMDIWQPGGSIPKTSQKYYTCRIKGQEDFERVLPLIHYGGKANIDRVEHAWKSAGTVCDKTFERLQSLCYKAKERKTYLCNR